MSKRGGGILRQDNRLLLRELQPRQFQLSPFENFSRHLSRWYFLQPVAARCTL